MGERRLDLVFETLADASEDVRVASENGYELVGQWSFAEILEHLNLTMQMTMDGADFGYPAIVRPLVRLLFMPTIKRGKPLKIKASAPKSLVPRDNLDEVDCVERFHSMVAKLSDPNTEFQPIHPLLGKLNRGQWLNMQKWHAAHHLSFVVPKKL